MTATSPTVPTTARTDGGRLLRAALRVDAVASGGLGVLGLAAAPLLAEVAGPPAALLRGLGAFLVVFAAGLVLLAARPRPPRGAVRAVVVGNGLWAVGSVLAAVVGGSGLTGFGVAGVLAQAAAVAAFAAVQHVGLHRLG